LLQSFNLQLKWPMDPETFNSNGNTTRRMMSCRSVVFYRTILDQPPIILYLKITHAFICID